jgi:sugar transferase (PEP-CTERM/EpsH1 system associated)
MHVVRTLATGGTENIVRKLLAHLDPSRFHQSVCTVVAADGESPFNATSLGLKPTKAAFLVPHFFRVFRRERPDVVHSRNWATIEAVIAAKLARVEGVVHSEHGRDLATMGPQPWRRRFLRSFAYARADRVFCVSEELREYYSEQLGWRPDSFSVISNGVDTEEFRPCPRTRLEMRAKLGAGPSTIIVGTVGRLDPVKDHMVLVRAAESARQQGLDLRLVIVGDGPHRASIERELSRSTQLARSTTLAGDVRNVPEWLNAFDIFVLPSISEGMSNTLLEAMATGIAPIATAVGGNRELIEHGQCGLLSPPGDPNALGNLILDLAQNQDRRLHLGSQARARVVSKFGLVHMLEQYEQMYGELIQPRALELTAPIGA